MNTTDSQPAPITSAELKPEGWAEGKCWVRGCHFRWSVLIPSSQIMPSAMPDIFGLPPRPRSYAEWEAYPEGLLVCQMHWSRLRTKHGTRLGYTMRNGHIRAYVAERYF